MRPICLIGIVLALFQSPPPTAAISGRVVEAGSGQPLAEATVSITRVNPAQGGATVPPSTTNDRGEFSFLNLAPGRYDLSARKSRYVTLAYGQRPGSAIPGISVVLSEGQQVRNLTIRLPLTSVIEGTVTNSRGEPAQGTTVVAYRLEWRNGERSARRAATDAVDDRGQYRIPGLSPGE